MCTSLQLLHPIGCPTGTLPSILISQHFHGIVPLTVHTYIHTYCMCVLLYCRPRCTIGSGCVRMCVYGWGCMQLKVVIVLGICLSLNVHTYTLLHTYIHTYIHVHYCIHTCVLLHTYMCTIAYIHVHYCIHTCVLLHTYICMYGSVHCVHLLAVICIVHMR